jgi:uncharacterized membrane protein YtjA (UPF0391 family)
VQRGAASFIASDRSRGTWCAAAKPARNFSFVRYFYCGRLSRAVELGCGGAQFGEVTIMLNLVVTLLIIALIAAVLGFGGIASTAVGLAKIVFFVALLLFLIAALFGMMRGPRAL